MNRNFEFILTTCWLCCINLMVLCSITGSCFTSTLKLHSDSCLEHCLFFKVTYDTCGVTINADDILIAYLGDLETKSNKSSCKQRNLELYRTSKLAAQMKFSNTVSP